MSGNSAVLEFSSSLPPPSRWLLHSCPHCLPCSGWLLSWTLFSLCCFFLCLFVPYFPMSVLFFCLCLSPSLPTFSPGISPAPTSQWQWPLSVSPEHNGLSLRIAPITGDSGEGEHTEHVLGFFSLQLPWSNRWLLPTVPSSLSLLNFCILITLYLA